MRCDEIMSKDVECLCLDATAKEAARLMRDTNVGFLPVCGPDGAVVGTLTDRDLAIRLVASGLDGDTRVGDLMSMNPITCAPSDDIEVAEKLMASHRKSRIMCIDQFGRVEGVVSLSDLAQRGDGAETLRAVTRREARA